MNEYIRCSINVVRACQSRQQNPIRRMDDIVSASSCHRWNGFNMCDKCQFVYRQALIFLSSSFSSFFSRFLFLKNVTQNMIDSFVYRIMRIHTVLLSYIFSTEMKWNEIDKKKCALVLKIYWKVSQTKRHILWLLLLDVSQFEPHNLSTFKWKFMQIFNSFNGSFINLDTVSKELKLKYSAEFPAGNLFIAVSTLRHSELPHLICIDQSWMSFTCFFVWRFPMAMPFSLY